MPALPPAALIFDMDGLLVDSEPLWLQVVQAFCRARGFELVKLRTVGGGFGCNELVFRRED